MSLRNADGKHLNMTNDDSHHHHHYRHYCPHEASTAGRPEYKMITDQMTEG